MFRHLLALLWMLLATAAAAQGVALSGVMGQRALLVIDGQTQMMSRGETARGVKLIEVQGDQVRIERDGQQLSLRVGAAPVSLGAAARAGGSTITMTVGSGGHFVTGGSINGRPVRFMVDTGATTVAMSAADAERIGLDYKRGERGLAATAGGTVPIWQVNLSSVRIGDVEVNNVDASVVQAPMPFVLLGNSFLSRFQMRREADVMRLERR